METLHGGLALLIVEPPPENDIVANTSHDSLEGLLLGSIRPKEMFEHDTLRDSDFSILHGLALYHAF
jgi:hypothetical protein